MRVQFGQSSSDPTGDLTLMETGTEKLPLGLGNFVVTQKELSKNNDCFIRIFLVAWDF